MTNKIEQVLLNLHAFITDALNDELRGLDKQNIFDDPIISTYINGYYHNVKEIHSKIALDEIILELKKLFQKVEPTKAVAESDELESWLDAAKRVNPEIRFDCYKKLLVDEKKGNIVEQLEADTFKILDSCHDPRVIEREWDRRGLVYGHVQSGKTANYIGLINRAFDAGYKIIIVLTGMTEDLRRQTQDRVDSGVIGKRKGHDFGIGLNKKFKKINNANKIYSASSIQKDLSSSDDLRDNILDLSKKSIWVIKKNKAVLETLILWLDNQRRIQNSDKIQGCPFLIIDDEADNASIQSLSKRDFELWETGQDLSKIDFENLTEDQEQVLNEVKERVILAINRNIRVVLSLIGHKTFVAYTATPYSVISGAKEDVERIVKIKDKDFIIEKDSNLFPEHFIIPIKPGGKYLGIERVFPTIIDRKLPIVVNLNLEPYKGLEDINIIFPSNKGDNYSFITIPKSLQDAIHHFLITILIRKYRGQYDYNTLLIHTSPLTKNADYVAIKIEEYIKNLCSNLNTDLGELVSIFNDKLKEIIEYSKNNLFFEYFGNQDFIFPEKITKSDLISIINDQNFPLDIVSLHSSNDAKLKHKNHELSYKLVDSEGKKKYRNYIVIGGNRLSRGLTLEGLSTSYFVRNSTRQDSLYQMARWFGYRIGYEDLVRIFLTNDHILWFEGVYKLEMDLRKTFEENNSDDVKIMPRDAIIKLAFHTNETMGVSEEIRRRFPAICDPNKLRNTSRQPMSFSGATKTNKIIYDEELQLRNMIYVKNFFTKISKDSQSILYDNSLIPDIVKNNNINFENVKYEYIISLLTEYEAHKDIHVDLDSLIEYIKKNKNELNNWSVVLAQKPGAAIKLKKINWEMSFYNKNNNLEIQEVTGLRRKWEDHNPTTKIISQFLDRGSIDNSFDIIDSENMIEFHGDSISKTTIKYRNAKMKPIFIVYPVLLEENFIFPLFYIIIPTIKNGEKVVYLIRKKR